MPGTDDNRRRKAEDQEAGRRRHAEEKSEDDKGAVKEHESGVLDASGKQDHRQRIEHGYRHGLMSAGALVAPFVTRGRRKALKSNKDMNCLTNVSEMVRSRRLELPRVAPQRPQRCASTNSATTASW